MDVQPHVGPPNLTLARSMVLFDDVVEVFGLPELNRCALFQIVALDRSGVGTTFVDGDLRRPSRSLTMLNATWTPRIEAPIVLPNRTTVSQGGRTDRSTRFAPGTVSVGQAVIGTAMILNPA
jgi:hypothetical protein